MDSIKEYQEKHMRMWDYIVKHLEIKREMNRPLTLSTLKRIKEYYLDDNYQIKSGNYCFACEYVYDKYGEVDCEHCPLCYGPDDEVHMCTENDSYYFILTKAIMDHDYDRAILAAMALRDIRWEEK